MAKGKQLSKKQLAVIEDLFAGELDEQQVLDKHKISRNVYNKWLGDERFADEFSLRIASAHRQGQLIIAKYASLAAAKLVELTASGKEETARKACLDIISPPTLAAKKTQAPTKAQQNASDEQARQLPPQTASRLLAALAEEKQPAPHGSAGSNSEGI